MEDKNLVAATNDDGTIITTEVKEIKEENKGFPYKNFFKADTEGRRKIVFFYLKKNYLNFKKLFEKMMDEEGMVEQIESLCRTFYRMMKPADWNFFSEWDFDGAISIEFLNDFSHKLLFGNKTLDMFMSEKQIKGLTEDFMIENKYRLNFKTMLEKRTLPANFVRLFFDNLPTHELLKKKLPKAVLVDNFEFLTSKYYIQELIKNQTLNKEQETFIRIKYQKQREIITLLDEKKNQPKEEAATEDEQ